MTEMAEKIVLSKTAHAAIDKELTKYPADQKQSAVMAALTIVQKEHEGELTEPLMDAVADYLDMPPIAVYEVATFYSLYNLTPVGKHEVSICTNVPCMLRGAEEVGEHMKKRLGVEYGETTKDKKITLKEVECLGACVCAPMMQVDDRYCEQLTNEKVDKILDELESS